MPHFTKFLGTSYTYLTHLTLFQQVGVYSVVTLGNTTRLFFVPSAPCYAQGLAFVQKVIDTLREGNAEKDEMLDTIFTEHCVSPTTEAWTKGLTSTPMLETRPSTTTDQPEVSNKNFPSPDLHLLPSSSPPPISLPSNLIYILLALTVLLSLLLLLATFAFCRLYCRRDSNIKPPQFLVMQVAPSSSSHNNGQLAPFPQLVQHCPQLLTIADLARQDVRQETRTSLAKLDSYGYVDWIATVWIRVWFLFWKI